MTVHTVAGADTLPGVLLGHAERTPDAPMLVYEADDGSRVERDWATGVGASARVANWLIAEGHAGKRVHVHLTNRPEFFDWWFGAAMAGSVIVPTNPLSSAAELAYIVRHADCALTVTGSEAVGTVLTAVADRAGHPVLVTTPPTPAGGNDGPPAPRLPDGARATAEVLAGAGSELSGPPRWCPSDVAGILYTSGTTSRPKGVLVTHAAYLHAGEVVAQHVRLRPDDRQLIVLPLFHGNAQYYSTMSAVVTCASIALTERFSASRWSAQAHRLAATYGSLFAAPIRMILAQAPSAHDRAHALRGVLFAQSVTDEQLAAFERRFGCPLLQLYGMTETVAPPTINPAHGERRNQSIGRPTLSAAVRVVDESGADVGDGETGQLIVRGEPGRTVMAGYLDDPEETARRLRDGWLWTGDAVRTDADGYVHFVDRDKDLIKRSGENVSTREVEAVLDDHPNVYESAVIGVPDEVRDEAIVAFVVPADGADPDPDELIGWCAQRLARFKVPSEVQVLEDLPRTSVGKIQKQRLKRDAGGGGPARPAG